MAWNGMCGSANADPHEKEKEKEGWNNEGEHGCTDST